MNIFILDTDLQTCSQYHADQHVVKMILESAQMLCTVLNKNGMRAPYRSTHTNHPCTLWAGESLANWRWLQALALNLNQEYRYRFDSDQDHKSAIVARDLPEPPIDDLGITEFAQAMPDEYKVPGDAVLAYRRFYLAEKSAFATWTKRPVPDWYQRGLQARVVGR
jgi:hypothetical protein